MGLRYPNPLALLDRTFHGLNLVGSWGDVSPQAPPYWQKPLPSVFPLHFRPSPFISPPCPLLSPLCLGLCQSLQRPSREAATSSSQAQACCSPSHTGAGPGKRSFFLRGPQFLLGR